MTTAFPPIYKSKAGYEAVMARYESVMKRGPVNYLSQKVKTRFGNTYVLEGGNLEGEPLILFHGWNGNAANIGANFPFLFDDYHVFMPDIIGQSGKSEATRPSTRGSGYVDWVQDLIDALKLPEVTLVGMSGGGWLSLKTASYLPKERIKQVVGVSIASLTSVNWISVLSWLARSKLYPASSMESFLRTNLASDIRSEKAIQFYKNMELLINHFKPNLNPHVLRNWELRNIESPLLVLMGDNERIFYGQKSVERVRKNVPGLVSAEIVPDAGHVMTIDRPDFLEERILKFLRSGK
ncbi:MAG: alpha/beta hydrolase [Chloroflexota bacterium]